MSWTDERVENLKKLWADGLSASQIATQLGGVSRNAVIGKVHRLNLPGRSKSNAQTTSRTKRAATATPTRTPSPSYPTRTSSPSPAQTTTTRTVNRSSGGAALKEEADLNVVAVEELDTRPIEDVVVPISRRLKLVELSERTCKWPLGDPLKDDFHFCGNDSGDASPYCTYHAKLAFQPSNERRRAR